MVQIEYLDKELKHFIQGLEKPARGKIVQILDLLRTEGHWLRLPHSRRIDQNLFELRIRGRQEVRIFYLFQNSKAILIDGYVKKKNTIPYAILKRVREKKRFLEQ